MTLRVMIRYGGSIEFGEFKDFNLTVTNTGSVSGTVKLRAIGDGWTLIGGSSWTLAASASANFQARFTANTGAFANVVNKRSGQSYQFNGIVAGDGVYVAKTATCLVAAKYQDTQIARFSSKPNAGNIFVPVSMPTLPTPTPGVVSKTVLPRFECYLYCQPQ
jgi:hypothetical protein